MARKLIFSLVALTLLTTGNLLQAQQDYVDFGSQQYVPFGPAGTPDWQWFAPLSAEQLTEKPYQGDGYFFSYEYLNWWLGKSDRAMIGSNRQQPVNAYYSHAFQSFYDPDTQLAQTERADRILVAVPGVDVAMVNSVMVADPWTKEGNGNRFEFGFVEDRWGWMVSVVDGIEFNSSQYYGEDDKRRDQLGAAQGLPGLDAFFTNQIVLIDSQPIAGSDGSAPVAPIASIQALLAIDGLLSVHMLFDDPTGSLVGFVDLVTNADGTAVPDGIADDLNGNGVVDDGDQVAFGATFDDMLVSHHTDLTSVELTGIRRKRTTYHGAAVDGFLGVRYLEFDDRMNVFARGGILADSEWNSQSLNRMFGPQIGFHYHKRTGRWDFGLQARGMFAANFLSQRLDGKIADHLPAGIIGAPNVAPTHFNQVRHDERFSPVGEFRAEASVLLTSKVAFKVGWNGLIIGGLSRAANSVEYALPKPGILSSTEEAFAQGVNVGFEINR